MPRRPNRPSLPEWLSSRPFWSQQDENQYGITAAPAMPGPMAQTSSLPFWLLARSRPFFSAQNRLRANIAIQSFVDIGALDSNIQAVGQIRIARRTDIGWVVIRHRKPPQEFAPPVEVAARPTDADLVGEIRAMRLEALWLSGAITDDEYFALHQAAA